MMARIQCREIIALVATVAVQIAPLVLIRRRRENSFETGPPPDARAIFTRFLETSCENDLERYSYRNLQTGDFLGPIEMRELEAGAVLASTQLATVDKRNNKTASRANPGGESRPSQRSQIILLRVLLCRIGQVNEEWKNVVFRLLQETKPYVSIMIPSYT